MYVVNIHVTPGYSFHLGCFSSFSEAKEKANDKVWSLFNEGNFFVQYELYKS